MQLLDELRREHDLIDSVLGALRTYAARFARGEVDSADGLAFVDFLGAFVGRWHHEREEQILFRALQTDALLPSDRGPLAVMLADHDEGSRALEMMRRALTSGERTEFERIASAYAMALWAHLDAENSVLFPESELQLKRMHVEELPLRAMPEDVAAAADHAGALAHLYGGSSAADVARGEGCMMCPAYGDACSGVEHEWWNEWQWEEFDEHIAGS